MREVRRIEKLLGIEIAHAVGQPDSYTLCGMRSSKVIVNRGSGTVVEYYRRINCRRCLKSAVTQSFITVGLYEYLVNQ